MSSVKNPKEQSEKELRAARALNTVATIGAGHALYAMTPEKSRLATRDKLLKLTPHKIRPKAEAVLSSLKQPELGGKLTTAGKVAAGGWLGLHSAELVGDVMARRSINNQLQIKQNKKSGKVMKNDMSMISKSVGYNRTSGHGVNLAKSDADSKLLNRIHELKEIMDKPTRLTRGEAVLGTAGVLGGSTAIHMARKKKKVVSKATDSNTGSLSAIGKSAYTKGFKESLARTKAENIKSKEFVEKNPSLKHLSQYKNPLKRLNHADISGLEAKAEQKYHLPENFDSLDDYRQGRFEGARDTKIDNYIKNRRKQRVVVGVATGATGAMATNKKRNVAKAYRRFDPEADRQRRIGQYQGLGLGASVVTGSMAGKHFTTHVKVSGKNARGIAAKPGSGRKGAALAAVSAVSAAGGLGAFKRGISERNQPWT